MLFPASGEGALEDVGDESGVDFIGVRARCPRVSRSTGRRGSRCSPGRPTQEIWVLRNLGFAADPVSTATINSAATDPLLNYDVIFNQGNYPATRRERDGARQAHELLRERRRLYRPHRRGELPHRGRDTSHDRRPGRRDSRRRSGRCGAGAESSTGTTPPAERARSPARTRVRDRAIVDPPMWLTAVPSRLDDRRQPPDDGILPVGALEVRRGCAVRDGTGLGGDRARDRTPQGPHGSPRSR